MIFVSGISASGKSHAASTYAAANGWVHVKASEILSKSGRRTEFVTKKEAQANQDILLNILKRCEIPLQNVLLDGHVTIETVEGQIDVPDWFFDPLGITKIICITSRSEEIARRRMQRGHVCQIEEIENAQKNELASAGRQALRLAIPFYAIASWDAQTFCAAIRR